MALLGEALTQEVDGLVHPHVHAPGDRPLEVVLLVRPQIERSTENELAPPFRVRLGQGVAPEREAGAQPVDALELGHTVGDLEYACTGASGVERLGPEALDEGRGRRAISAKTSVLPSDRFVAHAPKSPRTTSKA